MTHFTESIVEQAALAWLEALGWTVRHGPTIAPGEPAAERASYGEAVLPDRLRDALARLNPAVPPAALDEAYRKLTRLDRPTLIATNYAAHRLLVEGVPVEYFRPDRSLGGDLVRVLDYDNPAHNDWLAVNQFTVVEGGHERRADIVLFVNGLPLAVMELKNAADEQATIWAAFNQLQTYKKQVPTLFSHNAALVISDGIHARIGSLTADRERFMPWRTIDGAALADAHLSELQVVLEGVFHPRRFLDLARYFIVFEDAGCGLLIKKLAGYHQYHAVNAAVEETLRACAPEAGRVAELRGVYEVRGADGVRPRQPGDRRIGVIWHTQGSGKSLTMAFYAGKIIQHPRMANPTVVVLTDRNDLDNQLFDNFALDRDLLRQAPAQAESRADLAARLRVASGGVVFTTIQKFFFDDGDRADAKPLSERSTALSERSNIVVIADEAQRSQYDFIDGFARRVRDALPNASFIGFTGTPIARTDANTRAVFGDYISIYDIRQAVIDGATVPIYYENRLAKLLLDEAARPLLDREFEEATEGEEVEQKEKLKSRWAQLEALVGAERRIALVAANLVEHFERRLDALDGKAMVVCMSRRICVDLYNAIIRLRPDWHADDDAAGVVKIVMTGGAADPLAWQGHIRNKPRRQALAGRFRDPADPFRIVIVRDMWLTGFDAPCLHTMYVDKPMRGHGLMQAIARVNRVFRDKPGGLVVDYLGLAEELRDALATYAESGGAGETAVDQEQAVTVLTGKYEVCCALFHGFDWSPWARGGAQARLGLLPAAQEHILGQADGKARLLDAVTQLSQAFALAAPHEAALAIRDDVAFFQAVRAVLAKPAPGANRDLDALDHAIRQLVSRAIASDEIVDIFAAAGLKKPDFSILSDEFLADVRAMPEQNLAVELLRKLLVGEIQARGRRNVAQARSFAALLEAALRRYQNRAVESAQVIEELIGLAAEMRAADRRGEQLHLTEDEVAFYDALEVNDSAVKVLGDETLKAIARELVDAVRRNVTIDWTLRENVRARMRVLVKRILRKHGYPPDKQERATLTVLEQAEVLCAEWATV